MNGSTPFAAEPKQLAAYKFYQVPRTYELVCALSALLNRATERNVSGWEHMETGASAIENCEICNWKQKILSTIFTKRYCMQIFKC